MKYFVLLEVETSEDYDNPADWDWKLIVDEPTNSISRVLSVKEVYDYNIS
jgi:hypothetical protein